MLFSSGETNGRCYFDGVTVGVVWWSRGNDNRQGTIIHHNRVPALKPSSALSRRHFWSSYVWCILLQTFEDADTDKDNRICREEWRAFVLQHPSVIKKMTLPHLKYGYYLYFMHFVSLSSFLAYELLVHHLPFCLWKASNDGRALRFSLELCTD